jgi:hypothetical protein
MFHKAESVITIMATALALKLKNPKGFAEDFAVLGHEELSGLLQVLDLTMDEGFEA